MSSTILPPVVPAPNQDSIDLHRAFRGLGCDGDAIIRILAHRNPSQRAEIKYVYKNMFEEDLCQRLIKELHRDFEKAMILWMHDPAQRDAIILHRALLKYADPKRRNRVLGEILFTRSIGHIRSVVDAYADLYNRRSLQIDVEKSVRDPHCKKLFAHCLCRNQDDTTDLEPQHAIEEARILYNIGEGSSSHVDESSLIRMLTTRNIKQLRSVFCSYRELYGRDVHEMLVQMKAKNDSIAELLSVVSIITECVSNPLAYFAKVLYKSMKGLGTDDDTLIRVVVTRAEIDMANIKIAFFNEYRKSLSEMVISDTSGNYRKFLLALIGHQY